MKYTLDYRQAQEDPSIQTVSLKIQGFARDYTFKHRLDLALGDYVLCQIKGGVVLGKVSRVHEEVELEEESLFKYKWAFQKVNIEGLDSLNAEDKAFREASLNAEDKAFREASVEDLTWLD